MKVRGPRPHIAFVLGKPPRRDTVVAAVMDLLGDGGFDIAVHLPHDDPGPAPIWLFDVDLVVQRGLDPQALQALEAVEEAAVPCCNSIAVTGALVDRLVLCRRLDAAGIPLPRTEPAASWSDARAVAVDRPIVVKARDGRRGRGVQVVVAADGRLPLDAPFDGPYLVQDFVAGDGNDRKLYVAGSRLRGLLKPTLEHSPHVQAGTPFRPTPALAHVGHQVGRALGLDIFGVDIAVGPTGPQVIDVNPFPGFRGVPGAAELIARHLALGCRGPEGALRMR